MNRREAVQHISLLLGGTILGASAFISGCKSSGAKDIAFTAENVSFLDEVAETILPATKTPGAKAAKCGELMKIMVTDCYEEKDQKTFLEGIDKLKERSEKEFNKDFLELSPEQRHDLLVKLDAEQKEYTKNRKADDPPHYFRLMKELTLLGYFTSEIGCTQARRYVETPGRWDPCIPYQKGEKAFA